MEPVMTDEKQPPAIVNMEKDVAEKQRQGQADEALNAFEELQGETITLDPGTSKRLLRIIDWHLMPIMCFVYGMNYLDSMSCFALWPAERLIQTVQRLLYLMPASWALKRIWAW